MTARRSYSGNASAQTLTADLTSVATTATMTSATGWPTGANGPFAVVIDRGTNTEEKCLCSGLSGNTLTFQTRGYDGTGGFAHSSGTATVELCLTAIDLDEANAHTSAIAGVHGVSSNVVGVSDIQTLTNKTLTQPAISDFQLATHDHTTNAQGGALSYTSLSNMLHTGTVTGNPGASFSIINHGATFTPSNAFAYLTGVTRASGSGHVYAVILDGGITSSTLTVGFVDSSTGAPVSLTSTTINFTVFV